MINEFNEDTGLLSVSASIQEALAPVRLSENAELAYEGTFFPVSKVNKLGIKAEDYSVFAKSLADVSIELNNLLRILGFIVANGGFFEDQEPEDFERSIRSRLDTMRSALSESEKTEIIKNFLVSLNSGQYHVVKPSQRFNGGKDIIFSGVPLKAGDSSQTSSGVTINLSGYDASISSRPGSYYENLKAEHYQADPAQKAKDVFDEITGILFKKKITIEDANKWERVQIDPGFDFTILNKIFARAFSFNIEFMTKHDFHKGLSKNLSLLLMLPPSKGIVTAYTQYINKVQHNAVDKENPDQFEKPDHESLVTDEANKFTRAIGVSLAINLPKEYVDYISQNTEGKLNNFCLSSWVTQWGRIYLRAKGSRILGGGKAKYSRLPRYIIPASKNDMLTQYRKDNNMPIDPGRSNDDRISVSPRGTLTFMPKSSDSAFNNAEEYQEVLEKALELSYQANAPLTDSQTLVSRVFATDLEDPEIEQSIAAQKKSLNRFKGTLLSMNWDYNVSLTAGTGSPFVQIASDLNGSTSPSPLALADYLGYDFSDEGERKQSKSFVESLNYMVPGRDFSSIEKEDTGLEEKEMNIKFRHGLTFVHNIAFTKLLKTYTFLARKDKVRSLQALLDEGMKELDIENLNNATLDVALYSLLDENGKLKSENAQADFETIRTMLIEAMGDAKGDPGTNLYKVVAEEVGYENAAIEIKDHGAFFDQSISSMSDFGNCYNYLGGLLFKKVCEEITKVDSATLLKPLETFDFSLNGYSIPFSDISNIVMPLAFMFSKYVPQAMDIFERAENEAESYAIDTGIDVDDIQMPGIAAGSQVFPHQIKAHKYLRRRPKHAVLDVHPGGGKTITLILDIGNVVRELEAEGEKLRAVVMAPDKLVANWCEDTAKITKGSWNCIPITGESYASWGEEKLRELVQNAPANTIFFTGINFLKSGAQDLSFGPKKLKLYGGTEFIKSLGFNYVALDESHKAKQFNPQSGKTSAVHTTVKQVFTGEHVRYTRLATGTLIHGILQDVVGQAALFSSHIFRTPNDFNIDASAPDGAIRVRSKFGEHASVITIKRKEWAFMLPSPIDTFITVDLNEEVDIRNETLMQVYNALLQQTIDDLKDHIAKAKNNAASDESESDAFEGAGDDLDIDDEDELADIDPTVFKYYMQRLEQMLVDPWGDDAFVEAAEASNIGRDFVSPKVLKAVQRLDRHFTVEKYDPEIKNNRIERWEEGMEVRELSIVEYKGDHYMRRRMEVPEGEEITAQRKMTPPSKLPPTEDTDNWKLEMHGKVLIFCRYTRSTDAIFKALPPQYKAIARRFHGQVENKWQQIEDFKNDPDVKILVANEQAIVEGHNLQMASRIIRVETPWSPGDYEQSTARIFRPDPAAAKVENGKPGDMKREVIYIDWLMSEGTLEVAKVARLMWKTVEKTKFDEKGNPEYDEIMDINLPKIKMDIKTLTSASTDGFASFEDHFTAKGMLNQIESAEFHEMRKTTLATMQDLPETPPLPNFKKMDAVPILENQRIPDPDGFGLTRFVDWYGEWTDKNFDNDPVRMKELTEDDIQKLVKGLPVRSEFGTGVVVKAAIKRVAQPDGTKKMDPKFPISSFKIRYNSNDEIGTVKYRKLFVAADVSDATFDKFFKTNKPWATEGERKRIERAARTAEREEQKQQRAAEKREEKLRKKVEAQASVVEKARKRKDNASRGKPVNDGVVTRRKKAEPVNDGNTNVIDKEGSVQKDMKIKVIPTVFNGFLALHVNASDPDAKDLKQLGFKSFGEYAYSEFKSYKFFEKALDYVEDKFNLDNPSLKRLGMANDAFDDFQRMGFNMKQASKVQSDLPNFFRTRHRESNDKKTVKIYPVVLADRVRLTVDLTTSPLMRRHVGKTMPGAGGGGKWKLHEGMTIFFAVNKSNAKSKLRELLKAGYEITNMDKALKQIGEMKLVRSAAHNRELKQQAK